MRGVRKVLVAFVALLAACSGDNSTSGGGEGQAEACAILFDKLEVSLGGHLYRKFVNSSPPLSMDQALEAFASRPEIEVVVKPQLERVDWTPSGPLYVVGAEPAFACQVALKGEGPYTVTATQLLPDGGTRAVTVVHDPSAI